MRFGDHGPGDPGDPNAFSERRAGGEAGPKGPPPEHTGAESDYLHKNMEARTPMVVRLVGNEEVRGWIEYYDRDMIKLNRNDPPHLFIRKTNIKYIYKDEAEAARLSGGGSR